ncbi:putative disease resistance protein [Citrus sinensis]|nr:putative disease resistance protein [Citrus sinensis]
MLLMRDSGYALPTIRISARSTSPRSRSLLVCFLLPVFLRPQKQVRALRLFSRRKPSDAQVRYEGSGNACHRSYDFLEIGLADDVLVDEQDIPAPAPPDTRLLRDTPVRRTLPSDICSLCLVSSTQAGYICYLRDNLKDLRRESQKLIEERNDVRIRVIVAEQQQMKRLERVQGWFSRVQDVLYEVDRLTLESNREDAKLCLGGLCTKICKSNYKFGRKVFRTLREVQSLSLEGDFKEVAQPAPVNPVDERPLPTSVVGLQSTFERVWSCVMEDTIGIVGLYGMGGVGKTTLLTQINNKFLVSPNHFDFVIWVVVSKDLQLEKIQECVAEKIGLFNESWSSKNVQEKAQEIFKILSDKKFMLLLDDIWEPVDLAQVGLPIPSPRSTSSKVVFTSRDFEVCGQMEAHRSFKVECLAYEDAWELFEEKVGREILVSHPDTPELAEIVAKECGGLPLALITVGRAMASKKTPQEWEHAIEVLRSSSSKFLGLERWVYSRLKFSYDFLPTDTIRFCVFYCCLFPEDSKISIEDLIDCWICEGLLDEYDGFGARNQGAPRIGMWKEITRMSLMQNAIQNLTETPTCPHLRALFLHSNHLENLPLGILNLVSLQHLDLSWTGITRLPIELKYLVNLKCLNLEYTFRLSRIPQLVISDLKMLRALRMFECGFKVEQEADSILFGDSEVLVEELLALKHLNLLTITLQIFGALQRLLNYCNSSRSINTQSLCLRHLNNSNLLSAFSFASLRHLWTLHLYFNDFEELNIDAGEVKRIRETRGFHSLQKVYINYSKFRHATWLVLAPRAKVIRISNCQRLQEIISMEKLGEISAEVMDNLILFGRLEYLILEGLQNLKSIHSSYLPFPRLKEICVWKCAELKKLPLDCNQGLEQKIIMKGQDRWWNELQWDDQATQTLLLPVSNPCISVCQRLVAISGCGHLPHEECPKALVAAITPFISRLLFTVDLQNQWVTDITY